MPLVGSPGLYVPVHKRTGSSPSRTTSPRFPSLSGMFYQFRSRTAAHPTWPEHTQTRIYSPQFLLSLRPNADEGVKENMREACPEVVMSRRTRKHLEFSQPQYEAAERNAFHHRQPSLLQATAITALLSAPTIASPPRIIPRRNRRAGRATERRRQTLQPNFAWRERVIAPLHSLPVVQINTSP